MAPVLPLSRFIEKTLPGVPPGGGFDEKYFLVKHMSFYSDFVADSEYHMYCVEKMVFDDENRQI